jgi:magnesium-transporting ATPase (P-type)
VSSAVTIAAGSGAQVASVTELPGGSTIPPPAVPAALMDPAEAIVAVSPGRGPQQEEQQPQRKSLSVKVPLTERSILGAHSHEPSQQRGGGGGSQFNTPRQGPLSAHGTPALAPLSHRGSKFLTRTHVSYSNIPTAEEKIELVSLGGGPASNRTPKLMLRSLSNVSRSASKLGKEVKLISFHLNDYASIVAGHFPTNFIKTSKYTFLTFLPVNLFEQFRRVANLYFLFVVIIQTIPGVSPFPIYTSLAPLIFILAIGAVNEAREDVQRHKADAIANSRPCELVQAGGKETPITSASVAVGQIIKIRQGHEFPADLILLHTSREDGTCYVNTANLDGEAAPKVRSASAATQHAFNTPHALTEQLRGRIQYETPNASLYRFQGNVLLQPLEAEKATGAEPVLHPLGDKQLLLRGAKLVNTAYVYGLVVYTGMETKMMLNRNPARFKFSQFESQLNKCVVVCLLINLVVCLIPSFYYIAQDDTFARYWDIDYRGGLGWLLDFITLYILFSFMVPQSLYVTIELVKVGQAKFMEWVRHRNGCTVCEEFTTPAGLG